MSDETEAEVSEVRAGQRIAKVMARAGVCSRRDAEAWIAEGRVSVNGKVLLSPAFNVSEADDVRVDGKPLAKPERTRLFLFHKPKGLVTTARDPEGRPTVFQALPPGLPRVVAIGRLDINTEGLLLLSNDGGLARVLELPSTGWLRRYRVRAHGAVDQAALDRLGDGVTIDGVDYLGVEARLDREQGANAWMTLGLREGKNREIKKILEHLGLAVNRLIRVSFGPFELGDLAEGEVTEVRTRVLRDQLGVKLAKEAGANFDAPFVDRDEPQSERKDREPPRSERGQRESLGPERATPGRPGRAERGAKSRSERDDRPRGGPLRPSMPERRRKHVSALRAEIASATSDAKGPRRRIERSATHDRKGRTIAVERVSLTREEARKHPSLETRPKRVGPPNTGERNGRSFQAEARPGKPDHFGPSRGRRHEGRKRPPHPDHKEPGHRPERPNAGRGDGGPRERRFDRFVAKGDGDRRDRPSRKRGGADPARERNFDRPKDRAHAQVGEGRPSRSDAKNDGSRSDFKSRELRAGARDGDRPGRRVHDSGNEGGPLRGHASRERRAGRLRKGSPKGAGGSRRPPRKR
jgi:23S rRNA pseudouridine2605 synthase